MLALVLFQLLFDTPHPCTWFQSKRMIETKKLFHFTNSVRIRFFFTFILFLLEFSEICDQLQKDDEEWCYFMRYGKPRRNRAIPDLSKPIIPEDNATLERRKRRQKWWQWLNATLSCVCLALFITILIILFIIFSNVDYQEKSTSSPHQMDVFVSNNQSTTNFDSSNTSNTSPWILYPIQFYL